MNNSNSEKLNKNEGDVNEMFQLRDKSASLGNSIATTTISRPSTCINFPKAKIGSVKFDLPKLDSPSNNPGQNYIVIVEERDKTRCDNNANSSSALPLVEKCSDNDAEAVNNKVMATNTKMTISELNKIKRDAFFNNMDCSGSSMPKCISEDSSEKVKRIIENFKSEVTNMKMEITEPDIIHTPGKVSQLIGSFERQEIGLKCKSDSFNRNKERIDESQNEIEFLGSLKHKMKKGSLSDLNRLPLIHPDMRLERKVDEEKENHGQMVNTINDYLLPDRDFYGTMESSEYKNEDTVNFDEDDDISNGSEFEYRSHNEAREIVDTVSLALVELKQRQDHYDVRDKQMEEANHSKEISSSSSASSIERSSEVARHVSELKKLVPTQRKSKLQPEKQDDVIVGPLPPKPRPKMTDNVPELPPSVKPPVRSRTPPEPPPRPESTFSKVTRKSEKKDLSPVSDIKKGTISISPPICNVSGTSVNIFSSEPSSEHFRSNEVKQVPSPTFLAREPKPSYNTRGSSVLNVHTEKSKSGGTLESLKAMLSLGRKPLSFNSPRSVRKKNAMLARKRNVNVKDVTPCDNSGALWHRNRKGTAIAPWSKSYFVLQGPNFYGFKSKESQKADLFIHLPGFTCTLAEEVKSKEFSFKIYHTGTAFYFAANSKEDLQQWLDSVSMATICQDEKQVPESVTFSVSDSDSSDPELEPETCFPTSPKMKKFLGSSPVPKPARSHQNLVSDSKKTYDIQKRFGSLKKLSSQKNSSPSNNFAGNEPATAANTEIASLDRKYLRFLGHRHTPLPVPTSQFRSYRRMQPSVPSTMHGKPGEKNESIRNQQQPSRDQPGLVRKTFHLSNPSLIHPDMADYRITQERLAEFRRLRNQENAQESGEFMTLEQFMMTRQEEEAMMRSNRSRPPELRGFMTLEQFLLRQEEERQLSNRIREKAAPEECATEQYGLGQEEEKRRTNTAKITRSYPRGESSVVCSSKDNLPRSGACSLENPKVKPRTGINSKNNKTKFKGCVKNDTAGASTSSTASQEMEECSCASCESSLIPGMARKGRHSSEEDEPKMMDCPHLNKDPTPDYPGIEYPPAFEPETYTLQYMLKNRRKKSTNKTKREDK